MEDLQKAILSLAALNPFGAAGRERIMSVLGYEGRTQEQAQFRRAVRGLLQAEGIDLSIPPLDPK